MLCPESGLVVVASSRKVRSKVHSNAVKHCTGRLYIFLLALKLYHLVYALWVRESGFIMHPGVTVLMRSPMSFTLYCRLLPSMT